MPPMSDFAIHGLPCGGGLLALSPLAGRAGDYDDDLRVIIEWRPDMVISMTTAAEMAANGADRLAADLHMAAIDWRHLPVADFGVPEAATNALWPEVSGAARACLARGGRVLVHCFGGCGRSGMVALRLLIEAGEPAHDSLVRLRLCRPCAVETDAQRLWAEGGA